VDAQAIFRAEGTASPNAPLARQIEYKCRKRPRHDMI
jgi:hypothetical protein